MNGKDSKVPIYIAIIVALLLVVAGGYYLLGPSKPIIDNNKTEVPTPEETSAHETAATPSSSEPITTSPTPSPPALAPTIKCELCHKNSQDLTPHINGGKLCINCHGSQVHNIHVGSGTVNLECATCHGLPPNIKVPTVEKGEGPGHYSVCEQCHAAPPNSLQPSNGDLIIVHLSRGKYCTNCHGADIEKIHQAALANASKK